MAKKLKIALPIVVILILIVLGNSVYTVAENEYACIVRFSKIENTVSDAGLKFKIPFIDSIRKFPDTVLLYDIPPSEVFTSDKKNMTVDSYILWEISDPLTFFKSLGNLTEAEDRLNVITYNALKNTMSTLEQNQIINQDDADQRNDIYEDITAGVKELASVYGINVVDVKVKRLDLPQDNEQAVYQRMISERNQMAEKFTADGEYEASIIMNDVDKEVNIIVSNAEAEAARIEAEGEAAYMKALADAYDTDDKKEFYEFTASLDALKATLKDGEKTVIIGKDSKLAEILMGVN